jgi:hypothetical protein
LADHDPISPGSLPADKEGNVSPAGGDLDSTVPPSDDDLSGSFDDLSSE